MSNQHITQFLNYYIKLPNPQYAVLLKGKWGSGKTHFINEYRKSLDTNNEKDIYISLYGVTSYDEIETKFLQATNPEIFNEKTIYASKIAKAFLNEKIKSSWTSIKKSLSSLNAKERILIFDDIERCSLKIVDLLGYINNFVEHQSYKVILMANEEELNKTKKYKNIKEKLIGKTFEFKTNPSDAYDSFLSELKNERKVKEVILEKYKDEIINVFNNSLCNNLRVLRQTILDFERIFDLVITTFYDNEEFIKDFIRLFFIFNFEYKVYGYSIEEYLEERESCENNISMSIAKRMNKSSESKKELDNKYIASKNYENFLKKYKEYNINTDRKNLILNSPTWFNIIVNSILDKKEIVKQIKASKYFIDEDSPSWKKLSYYYNLTDEEFKLLLEDVFKEFKLNEYKDYKHFKLVASMLLYFQEKELLSIEFEKLFDLIKKNFNLLLDEKKLNLEDIYIIKSRAITDRSYESIGYFECENFEKLKSYINEVLEEKKTLKQKKDSEKIILAIKEKDTQILLDLLEGRNNKGIIDYRYKPILNNINIKELLNALSKTDGLTMNYFGEIIKDRYVRGLEILFEEEVSLKNILKKCEEYVQENKGKLSAHNLNEQVVENLKIALNQIEEIRNENNNL